ncbi:MAG: hypothetical protein QOC92_3666 [Acidimicrobiaceae bacterium]
MLGVACLLFLLGCGSSSDNGAAEARSACSKGLPAIEATAVTWGQTLDAFKESQTHSARAAEKDKRWAPLNDAFRTLVGAWTAAIDAGGRDATDTSIDPARQAAALQAEAEWVTPATQAESIIRSQCKTAEHA